jgi:hypothetical protein
VDLAVRELPGFRSEGLLPLVALFPLAGILRLLQRAPDGTRQTLFYVGCGITVIVLQIVLRRWLSAMRETQRLVGGRPPA